MSLNKQQIEDALAKGKRITTDTVQFDTFDDTIGFKVEKDAADGLIDVFVVEKSYDDDGRVVAATNLLIQVDTGHIDAIIEALQELKKVADLEEIN